MKLQLTTIILFISIFNASFSQRVIGYYPQWVQANLTPENIDSDIITHVIHAFAWPDNDGNILSYDNMISETITNKIHEKGGKILLSFGGWGNSWGFSSSTASTDSRSVFINNIISTCEDYGYDGVDIDWEHPSNTVEKNNLNDFIFELKTALNDRHPDWLISMAIPISNWSGQHYDLEYLSQYIDFFNAMTYDFHGSWSNHAGHNAPLYPSPNNDPDGSVSIGINYLVNIRNIPVEKVNLGLAFYGKEYNSSNINQSFSGEVSTKTYSEYASLIDNGWDYNWDPLGQVPFLMNTAQDKIITIEDSLSISLKCQYARQNNLGGMMIWALSYDYVGGNQLLINSIKNNYLKIDNKLNPEDYSIEIKNYPNPFNSNTIIYFNLNNDSKVDLKIFDITGNLSRHLVEDRMQKGLKKINWNGTNDNGEDVPAGVYLYQLNINETLFSNKMIYLK